MRIIRDLIFTGFTLAIFILSPVVTSAQTETAVFAGGCFWTMQSDFDKVPGVIKTIAGYTGGTVPNPTYEQVEVGDTGHYEAIQVSYNPTKISYQKLLTIYWHNIDPTNGAGQFCDIGSQYRPVIFYQDSLQQQLAEQSKEEIVKSGRFPVVATQILPAATFYSAEAYHQEFYRTHAGEYNLYKYGCGRDAQLQKLWGKTK